MRPVVAVTAVLFAAACSSGIVEQVGNPDATSTRSVDAGEGDLGNEAGRPSEAGTADGPATVGDSAVIVTDGDAGAVITDADSGVVVTPADSGVVGGDDSGAVIHPDGAQLQDSSGVGNVRDTGGAESSSGSTFDGTTGQLCVSTADCKSVNGPGINRCSVSGYFAGGPIDPSPVCLSPDPCDLGDGSTIQFCDSANPADPNSPGVCLPTQQGATGLNGQCFPKCVIPSDGTPPQGCQGKNACNFFASSHDNNNQPLAIGFCVGGCTADTDCPTGSKCQKDEGTCLTTLKTPTKQLGQTCSASDVGSTQYGCNCFTNQTTSLGYCSQACIVGPSSPQPCPAGFLCDSQLPAQITGANDAAVPGFTQQNDGLAGLCLQACSPGDAGLSCPATASCSTQDTAGADCIP